MSFFLCRKLMCELYTVNEKSRDNHQVTGQMKSKSETVMHIFTCIEWIIITQRQILGYKQIIEAQWPAT